MQCPHELFGASLVNVRSGGDERAMPQARDEHDQRVLGRRAEVGRFSRRLTMSHPRDAAALPRCPRLAGTGLSLTLSGIFEFGCDRASVTTTAGGGLLDRSSWARPVHGGKCLGGCAVSGGGGSDSVAVRRGDGAHGGRGRLRSAAVARAGVQTAAITPHGFTAATGATSRTGQWAVGRWRS